MRNKDFFWQRSIKEWKKEIEDTLISEFIDDYDFLYNVWIKHDIATTEDICRIHKDKEKWEKRRDQ